MVVSSGRYTMIDKHLRGKLYKWAFEGTHIGMAVLDLDGNVMIYNSEILSVFQIIDQDIYRQNIMDLLASIGIEAKFRTELMCQAQKGISQDYKVKQNGTMIRRYHIEVCSLFGEKILFQIQDSTLFNSNEGVTTSDKVYLSAQMAMGIAHEVRNPLTSIKGFIQLLDDTHINVEQKGYLRVISDELDRMEAILSELLILGKPKKLTLSHVEVSSLCNHVLQLIEMQSINSNITIFTTYLSHLPPLICDEDQIKQVFLNLLKNAIEAMPSGGHITIRATRQASNIQVEISDQGEGIPKDIIAHFGEPFQTTKSGGTGLGLSICHKIIENHEGKMEFITGRTGTTFNILLPISGPKQLLSKGGE